MTVHAIRQDDTSAIMARIDDLAKKFIDLDRTYGKRLSIQRKANEEYKRLGYTRDQFYQDWGFKTNRTAKTCRNHNSVVNSVIDLLDVTDSFTKAMATKYIKADDVMKAKIIDSYKNSNDERIKEVERMDDDEYESDFTKAKTAEMENRHNLSEDERQSRLDSVLKDWASKNEVVPETESELLEMIALNVITGAFLFDDILCLYNTSPKAIISAIQHELTHSSPNTRTDPKVYKDFTAQVKRMVDILSSNINEVSDTAPLNSVK